VPLAKRGWQIAPWAAGPHDPQHRFDEAAVITSATPGIRRLTQAMRFHLRPLGVCQYQTNHRKLESQSSFQWNPESQQTLDNWQSEFLQLLWQVGGLAYF